MKILIIAGTLEPGAGGVGDHCRNFAGICREHDHATTVCGLYDHHIRTEAVTQASEKNIEVRLPASSPEADRVRTLERYISNWSPDLISLHWVPHAYHPKGLPVTLPGRLEAIFNSIPLQIYFHELWVRAHFSRPQSYFYSRIQKRCVKSLLKIPGIRAVHTSNRLWQENLKTAGCHAKLLPLFGNFPVQKKASPEWWNRKDPKSQKHDFRLGLFGTLYPDHSLAPRLEQLARQARTEDRKLRIFHAGNLSPTLLAELEVLSSKYDRENRMTALGHLQPAEVGQYLLGLDAVLTSVDHSILPKSSNCVTALEHGIPLLLCDPGDFHPEAFPFPAERSRLIVGERFWQTGGRLQGISSLRLKPIRFLPNYYNRWAGDLGLSRPTQSQQ